MPRQSAEGAGRRAGMRPRRVARGWVVCYCPINFRMRPTRAPAAPGVHGGMRRGTLATRGLAGAYAASANASGSRSVSDLRSLDARPAMLAIGSHGFCHAALARRGGHQLRIRPIAPHGDRACGLVCTDLDLDYGPYEASPARPDRPRALSISARRTERSGGSAATTTRFGSGSGLRRYGARPRKRRAMTDASQMIWPPLQEREHQRLAVEAMP